MPAVPAKPVDDRSEASGSQSIGRAIGLLRILTQAPQSGMTLAAIAALSVAAIDQRMTPKRCGQIARIVQAQARALAARFDERRRAGGAPRDKSSPGGTIRRSRGPKVA